MTKPYVSVIIPVYNDLERLNKCLESFSNQTYPKNCFEVIVVDNNSDKKINKESLAHLENLILEFEFVRSSYAARNKGVSVSKGDIIAFTDSDCIPESNWIERGVNSLSVNPGCGLLAGKINIFSETSGEPNSVEKWESIFAFPQKGYVDNKHFGATANVFTSRDVIEDVGKFNEKLKSSGDREWGNRVYEKGYQLIYADDVCVNHPSRTSLCQIHKKQLRIIESLGEIGVIDNGMTKRFFKDIAYEMKPPLNAARTIFKSSSIDNLFDKLKVMCVHMLVRYMWIWGKLKYQLRYKYNKMKAGNH